MTDVCLILEGTYPYVAGGVSTWVYQLLQSLPDKTFSIIYLGAHRPAVRKMHYEIPANVVDFKEYYLFDYRVQKERKGRIREEDFEIIEDVLRLMPHVNADLFGKFFQSIGDQRTRGVDLYDLAHSPRAWEMLRKIYAREKKQVSFIDYFWTWRFIYLPFFALLRIPLSAARVYHTVSTGYAGLVGCLCRLRFGRPLILTEHGIYTRERKIEISQAQWIYSEMAGEIKVRDDQEFFKSWWTDIFSFFSRLTYEMSDEIITLYEGNRQIQIAEGADPQKTRIIPNGIDITVGARHALPLQERKFRIGFMGRVVPIKDVKTFIKACRMIREELKDIEVYIMGPTDEDEEYCRECLVLTEMEGLKEIIHFTGKVKVSEYYPKIDVLVLTSISEAQPIVILEAQAYGIPVVATDVGACQELVYGQDSDDKLLGASGTITPVYEPDATARAVVQILKDPELYARMSDAGRERSAIYYQLDDVISRYERIYTHYTEKVCWGEALWPA